MWSSSSSLCLLSFQLRSMMSLAWSLNSFRGELSIKLKFGVNSCEYYRLSTLKASCSFASTTSLASSVGSLTLQTLRQASLPPVAKYLPQWLNLATQIESEWAFGMVYTVYRSILLLCLPHVSILLLSCKNFFCCRTLLASRFCPSELCLAMSSCSPATIMFWSLSSSLLTSMSYCLKFAPNSSSSSSKLWSRLSTFCNRNS